MTDTKTWYDIADTAIKIGLGGLIGGFTGIWLAKINNRHLILTANQDRRRRILEDVLEHIDCFNYSVNMYWAQRANAAYKVENNETLTEEEIESLNKNEEKLFEDFNIITTCKSKLILIGAKDSEENLIIYHDAVDQFFKISGINSKDCSEQKLIKLRKVMSDTRKDFFESLSHEYLRK
jgi:hypothetical protein